MDKYLKDDYITVYVSVGVIALCYYALKVDFSFWQNKGVRANQQSIGKVTKIVSDVRVRNSKNIFWSEARKNDVVGIGDSVFVGPNSNTIIKFQDGKSITVGSNSLVKFNTESKNVKLSLEYGSIKSNSLPDSLVLDDCGQTLHIESAPNSDLEIGKSDCGKVQVKSTRGAVRINKKPIAQNSVPVQIKSSPAPPLKKLKEKPVVNLSMAQLEKLNPAEVAKVTSLSLDDLQKQFAPAPIAVLSLPPQKPLLAPQLIQETTVIPANSKILPTAAWVKSENAKEYILETADNPEFRNVRIQKTIATSQVLPVSKGSIYYRLKSVNETKSSEYSKTGLISFALPKVEAPKPIVKQQPIATPIIDSDYTSLTYFFQKTGPYLWIKWAADMKLPHSYQVEISKKANFKKITKRYNTKESTFVIGDVLPVGRYFWRVRTEVKGETSAWSKTGILEIIPGKI